MTSRKPYFIDDESPQRLRKLLIKNPFLPTLYENIRAKNPITESIPSLSEDDPLVEFILLQLDTHGLVEKTDQGYAVKYSRIVPPRRWENGESHEYAEHLLSYAKDVVIKTKDAHKKIKFGHYSGCLTEADYSSMIEQMVAVIDSFNDKPDGPIKYQTTFISKQL